MNIRNMVFATIGLAILIFLVGGFSTYTTIASPSQSDVPYLYYYSIDDGGFVVADAYNRNKRILAEYEFPGAEIGIHGSGWSPSGEWFSWHDPRGPSVYVVDRNGERVTTLFEEGDAATWFTAWSPTDDLLFIFRVVDGSRQVFYLYDASHATFKFEIDEASLTEDFVLIDLEWTPNGSYAVVYSNAEMFAFSTDGSVTSRPFKYRTGTLLCQRRSMPYWSANETVAYEARDGNQLFVENFALGTTTSYELSGTLDFIDWHPTEDIAFIYTRNECEDFAESVPVWLLGADNTLITISNEAVAPYNLYDYGYFPMYPHSNWSPNQAMGLIRYTSHIDIVSTSGELLDRIELEGNQLSQNNDVTRWSPLGSHIASIWQANSANHQLLVYDLETKETHIIAQDRRIIFVSFSYDSRLVGTVGGDNPDLLIHDLATEEVTTFQFQINEEIFGYTHEIIWHPDSQWFIAAGHQTGNSRGLNVFEAFSENEPIIIGTVSFTAAGFGWMPDVVENVP